MGVNVIWIWIGVGGVAGLLASMLLSHVPVGVIGSIIIGIVGGVLGGLIFSLLNLPITSGVFTNAGVAFLGSVLLLGLAQKLL